MYIIKNFSNLQSNVIVMHGVHCFYTEYVQSDLNTLQLIRLVCIILRAYSVHVRAIMDRTKSVGRCELQ